jgi:hypothetical protein
MQRRESRYRCHSSRSYQAASVINFVKDKVTVTPISFREQAAYTSCTLAGKSYAVEPEQAVFEPFKENDFRDLGNDQRMLTLSYTVPNSFGKLTHSNVYCTFDGNRMTEYHIE